MILAILVLFILSVIVGYRLFQCMLGNALSETIEILEMLTLSPFINRDKLSKFRAKIQGGILALIRGNATNQFCTTVHLRL